MFTLTAFGDVMMGVCSSTKCKTEDSLPYLIKHKILDLTPFSRITDFSDFNIVNLETPVTENVSYERGKKNLIASSEGLDILKKININLATLANNHIFDFGIKAVEETKKLLREKDIDYVHSPQFNDCSMTKTINGSKVTFIAYGAKPYYNVETDHLDPDYYKNYEFFLQEIRQLSSESTFDCLSIGNLLPLLREIEKKKGGSDAIIILIHWGFANTKLPSPLQIEIAHKLIDFGADVIIGNHPHVIQPVEYYQGKLIAYSLGNFIFDSWKTDKIKSLVLKLVYNGDLKAEYYISSRNGKYNYSLSETKMTRKAISVNSKRVEFLYPGFMENELSKASSILSSYKRYAKYRNECRNPTFLREFQELLRSDITPRTKMAIIRRKIFKK
jgi:hypothetical protein